MHRLMLDGLSQALYRGIGSITLSLVLVVLGSSRVEAQQFGGTVTQDPASGLATYDFHFSAPPAGQAMLSLVLPVLDPNAIQLPLIAPPGWTLSIVSPPLPPSANYWSWDPLADPKLLSNPLIYGSDSSLWVNPPAWLFFEAITPADAVAPGTQLGGFQFQSHFLPINAPALYKDDQGQVILVDPPTPDPTLPLATSVPILGPAAAALLAATLLLVGYRATRSA